MYFEGTKCILGERNVFRGNEIYLEGSKYISMERNNISDADFNLCLTLHKL